MSRVTVIDYQAGNLASVVKALRYLGAEVSVTDDAAKVVRAERLMLPGVGHFSATQRLNDTGMTRAVRESAARGVPFLGICVGMQWLMEGSGEAPDCASLGAFEGVCTRFPDGSGKVPHVGWNTISPRPHSRLLRGVTQDAYAYFTHSWRVPLCEWTAAETDYIGAFTSVIERENLFGVQFHPEKSGEAGLAILQNFLELPC